MTILWFDMNGFYEAFFDDAELASRLLGIPVETRITQGTGVVPVVRLPNHAAKGHFTKLHEAGVDLGICEDFKLPGMTPRTVLHRWKGGDA